MLRRLRARRRNATSTTFSAAYHLSILRCASSRGKSRSDRAARRGASGMNTTGGCGPVAGLRDRELARPPCRLQRVVQARDEVAGKERACSHGTVITSSPDAWARPALEAVERAGEAPRSRRRLTRMPKPRVGSALRLALNEQLRDLGREPLDHGGRPSACRGRARAHLSTPAHPAALPAGEDHARDLSHGPSSREGGTRGPLAGEGVGPRLAVHRRHHATSRVALSRRCPPVRRAGSAFPPRGRSW